MALKKIVYKDIYPPKAFILMGSGLPAYRLAYMINEVLRVELKDKKALSIFINKTDESVEFPFFMHRLDRYESSVCFVQNKLKGYLILPKMSNIDYFFIIREDVPDGFVKKAVESLRKTNSVTFASILDFKDNSIFNTEMKNFLNELEIHVSEIEKIDEESKYPKYIKPEFE